MGLENLIGNDALKNRLTAMLKSGRVSHCYLITGPLGSGKHTFAELFAAAAECTSDGIRPCCTCSACRKVLNSTHPDVIHVDDTERKEIKIDLVRSIVSDAYIRPNEGTRKVYVFDHAEKLNAADQNALLKMLEEPPAHALFFLLIPNSNLLLATIRSRCPELALEPIAPGLLRQELEKRIPGRKESEYAEAAECCYLGPAMDMLRNPPDHSLRDQFAAAYSCHDALALLRLFTGMERMNRDALAKQLEEFRVFLAETLCVRYGQPETTPLQKIVCDSRAAGEILKAIDVLQNAEAECSANVNTANICASLSVKLN